MSLSKYRKDYYGGGLIMLVGVGAIWKGVQYHMGTLNRMGPGFFPVAVGAVLAATGLLIALFAQTNVSARNGEEHPPEWRGWICIVLSILAFVIFGRYGGLLPAAFAVVFISALGDRQNTLKSAFFLATAMVVVCLVVFSWGLQLQFPLFRWG